MVRLPERRQDARVEEETIVTNEVLLTLELDDTDGAQPTELRLDADELRQELRSGGVRISEPDAEPGHKGGLDPQAAFDLLISAGTVGYVFRTINLVIRTKVTRTLTIVRKKGDKKERTWKITGKNLSDAELSRIAREIFDD
jgi:hypothetical protein